MGSTLVRIQPPGLEEWVQVKDLTPQRAGESARLVRTLGRALWSLARSSAELQGSSSGRTPLVGRLVMRVRIPPLQHNGLIDQR